MYMQKYYGVKLLINPTLDFNSWSLGMDKQFYLMLYNGCDYLSMPGSGDFLTP